MIDRLIHEFIHASDDERKEFCRRVTSAGVSAEELTKAASMLSEIAKSIKH